MSERVRVLNRAGRVCAIVDVADVASIHCNPEDGVTHMEIVLRSGGRVQLENVEPVHVFDRLFPESDSPHGPSGLPGDTQG